METQLWAQIERIVQGGEKEDIRLFVALTREEMARRFSTAEELQRGYQQLAVHLHRLKARDDFWGWVDQQFPLGETTELVVTPGLEEAIVNDLSRLSLKRPVAFSLRDIPNRLLAGGWAFSLVWFGLALVCGEFDQARIMGGLELAGYGLELLPHLLTIALWSVLCQIILAPVRPRWRGMVHGVPPLLSGAITGGVLCGLGLIVYLSGRYSLLILQFEEKLSTNLALTLVAFLRPGAFLLDIQESETVAAGVLVAWLAISFLCGLLRKRPWLVQRQPGPGNWILSGAIVLGLSLTLVHYLNLVHRTHELSRTLMANEATATPVKPDSELARRFVAKAGKIDRPAGESTYFNEHREEWKSAREQVYKIFLDTGKELWNRSNWWEDPAFAPLARQTITELDRFRIPGDPVMHKAKAIEAELRLSFFEFSPDLLSMVEKVQLTESEWNRLLPLTDEMVGRPLTPAFDFSQNFREVVRERSFSFLEGWFFNSSEVRDALEFQKQWESYQSHKALLERETFYSREESFEVERQLDSRTLNLFRLRIQYATLKRKRLLLWFLVRIRAEMAAGRPLPKTLEDFHPPWSHGTVDWFEYDVRKNWATLALRSGYFLPDYPLRIKLPQPQRSP